MSGLRIHHPSLHSCILQVPHPGNSEGRSPKDYVIHLDSEGYSIVSETVWMRLEEARISGHSIHQFMLVNVVGDPPTVQIGGLRTITKVFRQNSHHVSDTNLEGIAQQYAPSGIRARIKGR